MANFLSLLKKPSAIVVMLFCVVLTTVLYFQDHKRVREHASNPESVWTITMNDEATSYTFRGPLDMFLIHRSLVTNHRKLTAHVKSLTMEWHYETGQPWRQWARENTRKPLSKDKAKLSASVGIVSADIDSAETAKSIYLDKEINKPNPAQAAKPMGKVWNNTASKFERRSETYYLIEEREPDDGRVITCGTTAAYCSLRGAMVTDTLRLNDVLVLKEDVMNWKNYQDKARSLIQQAIVD